MSEDVLFRITEVELLAVTVYSWALLCHTKTAKRPGRSTSFELKFFRRVTLTVKYGFSALMQRVGIISKKVRPSIFTNTQSGQARSTENTEESKPGLLIS